MKFDLLTLFPEMFSVLDYGVVGRAKKNKQIQVNCWNPRDPTAVVQGW
jgi:tRNA (guanine37-N1)-methyltransferase